MKKSVCSLGLFFLFFVSSLPILQAQDELLQIQAVTDQNSVKSGMMFLVHAKVVNTSADSSTGFWGNTCSYEKHWVTDNPGVLIQSWTCGENALEEITLAPGDVYEKNIIVYIPEKDKTGPVTFRMGFKRMSENGDIDEPLWSDPVTMNVIVPDEMKEAVPSEDIAALPAQDTVVSGTEAPSVDHAGEDLQSDEPLVPEPVAPEADESKESLPQDDAVAASLTSDQPLLFQDPGVPIDVKPGDEFSISLASNPSTGFRWKMTLPEGTQLVTFLGSEHVAAAVAMPGAPGTEVFKFKAIAQGEVQVAFVYERPWETITAPTRKIFTILVEED